MNFSLKKLFAALAGGVLFSSSAFAGNLEIPRPYVLYYLDGGKSGSVFKTDSSVYLSKGSHQVVIRFEGWYRDTGDSRQQVSSEPVVINMQVPSEETNYKLDFINPRGYAKAKEYVKHPIVKIVDDSGATVEAEIFVLPRRDGLQIGRDYLREIKDLGKEYKGDLSLHEVTKNQKDNIYGLANAKYIQDTMDRLKTLKPEDGPSALQEFGIDLTADSYDVNQRLRDAGLSDDEIRYYTMLYDTAVGSNSDNNPGLAKEALNLIPENVFKELHNADIFNKITEPRRKAQEEEETAKAFESVELVEPIGKGDRRLFDVEGLDEFGNFKDKWHPKTWWNGLKLLSNKIVEELDWTDADSGFISKGINTALQSGIRVGAVVVNGAVWGVVGGAQDLISSPGQTVANLTALGMEGVRVLPEATMDVAGYLGIIDTETVDNTKNFIGDTLNKVYTPFERHLQALDLVLAPVTQWVHPLEALGKSNPIEERAKSLERMQHLTEDMGLTPEDLEIIAKYGKEKNAGYSVYSQDVADWLNKKENPEKLKMLDSFYKESKKLKKINDSLSLFTVNTIPLEFHIPKVCRDFFKENWAQGRYKKAIWEGLNADVLVFIFFILVFVLKRSNKGRS